MTNKTVLPKADSVQIPAREPNKIKITVVLECSAATIKSIGNLVTFLAMAWRLLH